MKKSLLLIGFLAVISVPVMLFAGAGPNIGVNGGNMEDTGANWVYDVEPFWSTKNSALVTDICRSVTHSLKVPSGRAGGWWAYGGNTAPAYQRNIFQVPSVGNYVFRFWAKTDAAYGHPGSYGGWIGIMFDSGGVNVSPDFKDVIKWSGEKDWTQVSIPFTIPDVTPNKGKVYTMYFQRKYGNAQGTIWIDDMTLHQVLMPVADAGEDITIEATSPGPYNVSSYLDASGSYDPAYGDLTGCTLSWSPDPTMVGYGTTEFTLTVTDELGQQATDKVLVTVRDTTPPVADAGSDQSGIYGSEVTLDGTGSYDVDGVSLPLSYAWSTGDTTPTVKVVVTPGMDEQFGLVVTDARSNVSVPDYVRVEDITTSIIEMIDERLETLIGDLPGGLIKIDRDRNQETVK